MRNLTAPARRPHGPTPARPPRDAGISLVLLIAIIVALSALVSGVVSFLATSGMDTAVSNLGDKVFYSSESGIRYLAAQYKNTGDTNGNGFADDDKANVLIALDGGTVNLPNNLGSFALDVYPYWFISTAGYSGATTITVRFPGTMPAGYAFPATGILDVEDNSLHAYTSVNSANAPLVTFNLSTPVTLDAGKSVYMTLPPTGSQSVSAGGSLTLSTTAGSIFPDRLGQIEANNKVVTYERASFSNGVLTLSGLSGAASVGAGDRVILKKNAMVGSQGQAGSGMVGTSNLTEFNLTFADDEPPGTEIGDTDPMFANNEVGFENLDDFRPNSKFTVQSFVSGTGAHPYYAATVQPGESEDPDSACGASARTMRYETLVLNKNSVFAQAWQNSTHHLLSYDTQVKISWNYKLAYAAGGISFRYHQSSTSGKYNTLGLSFMRYKNLINCPQGNDKDDIPNTIKPTTSGGGSLADRCLLVLWKQEVDSNGHEHKKWIAYKDLTSEICVRGNQWQYDGQCVTDNSAMLARVLERSVNGTKVSDISVFFGDASSPGNSAGWTTPSGWPGHNRYTVGGCGPRIPNAVAYDDETDRQVYFPSYDYATGQSPYPAWPPVKVADWNASLDYYTFVEHGGGSPAACSLCTWDRVNSDAEIAANFQAQSDGGTLRTSKFVTPTNGTFPANRDELGLHNFSGGSSGANQAVTYDEFTVQFLAPNTGTVGGVSGAVMR